MPTPAPATDEQAILRDEDTRHRPRPYCTQPRVTGEGCETCSLVNYGRDCRNQPIANR